MAVISDTQEAEIGKIAVWGQPGQKCWQDPISTNKPGVKCVYVASATWEIQVDGSRSRLVPDKNEEAFWKNKLKAKRAGGKAQVAYWACGPEFKTPALPK
jgi:hypothetical protein